MSICDRKYSRGTFCYVSLSVRLPTAQQKAPCGVFAIINHWQPLIQYTHRTPAPYQNVARSVTFSRIAEIHCHHHRLLQIPLHHAEWRDIVYSWTWCITVHSFTHQSSFVFHMYGDIDDARKINKYRRQHFHHVCIIRTRTHFLCACTPNDSPVAILFASALGQAGTPDTEKVPESIVNKKFWNMYL